MEDTYLLTMRCPVYRRRDSHSGSRTELETLIGDVKGKRTSGDPTRPKVPMRRSGSDRPILVMKWGNAHGAKGAGHSRRDRWVNRKLEEPAGFDGRRQPLLSGTSRMTRECHVRFCEGLGVQFPESTRPSDRDDGGVSHARSKHANHARRNQAIEYWRARRDSNS